MVMGGVGLHCCSCFAIGLCSAYDCFFPLLKLLVSLDNSYILHR